MKFSIYKIPQEKFFKEIPDLIRCDNIFQLNYIDLFKQFINEKIFCISNSDLNLKKENDEINYDTNVRFKNTSQENNATKFRFCVNLAGI